MTEPRLTRYELVSRRAMLKASLGAGAVAIVPGLACGNLDEEVLAGESVRPTTTRPPTTTTTAPPTTEGESAVTQSEGSAAPDGVAVAGEMVVSFTYTQASGGKNERPYIAVWIEDSAGELVETVSLWYQLTRRGDRWLDHLTRWYDLNLAHVSGGGADGTVTVSSATRTAGSYAVVWDGTVDGALAPAGDYYLCIEAVREEGPYSLIREPFSLTGSLAETVLPDEGELSGATVRIDA